MLRWQLPGGKPREQVIGRVEFRPLAEARDSARELAMKLDRGVDPIAESESATAATEAAIERRFVTLANQYIEVKKPEWTQRHADQWQDTIDGMCAPLHDKDVAEITSDDVVACVTPHWGTVPETASRARSRIELVLSFATAKKMRTGANPAVWRGLLEHMLPKPEVLKAAKREEKAEEQGKAEADRHCPTTRCRRS